LSLGVLTDVLHQDAARAAAARGDLDAAARHLRTAARVGPASRRAFHWWTLGSLYFLAGRHTDAIGALERASRWAGQTLVQVTSSRAAAGEEVGDLDEVIERLASVPAGRGYGPYWGCFARAWQPATHALICRRSWSGRRQQARTTIALDAELPARDACSLMSRGR
jgi:tetratricopeptide (TPR) repeat protein